jgi:hypothetical protein
MVKSLNQQAEALNQSELNKAACSDPDLIGAGGAIGK